MNGDQFISLIKDYFEKAADKFGDLSRASSDDPGIKTESVEDDMGHIEYYKAWLVIIFRMVDVITDEGVHVNAAEYFAYHALLKNPDPPYGPLDPSIHRILGIFRKDEVRGLLGECFLEKYQKTFPCE